MHIVYSHMQSVLLDFFYKLTFMSYSIFYKRNFVKVLYDKLTFIIKFFVDSLFLS